MDRVIQAGGIRRPVEGGLDWPGLALGNLFSALALLAWAGLLGTTLLDPQTRLLGGASLLDLRSGTGAVAVIKGLVVWGALQAVRFVPLGLLAVLSFPDRAGRLARGLRVALPAFALSLVLACTALAARSGFTLPGLFELLVPAAGILLGAWAGLAWRRGWWSRLLFLPKLAVLAAGLLLAGVVLVWAALEREPAVPEPAPLTSAERRQLVGRFRGKDPRKIPEGEARTLRLSTRELDQLVAWAAAVGVKARTTVSLAQGGVSGVAAVPVPRTSLWLNIRASALADIQNGRPSVSEPRLQAGRLRFPPLLLDTLVPVAVAGLRVDRDLRRVLPAVERLTLGPDEAVLTYRRVDMPRGLVARLVWGEDASEAMREAVYAQVDRLLEVLPGTPTGDARFGRALETAFALARERAAQGSAVEENRAALLALGVVLGHPRLARAVGEKLDDERVQRVESARGGTTLRGRNDWTRHFSVSGALTVLSAVAPSDAAGLLKEEMDADGGSGFSFGDLLADRSGTTFAEVATRDEANAAAMQARLAAGFRTDDFFPAADGLPEGIPDAELQSRYGGVGGPLYRRLADEIERRVAACAAY
jgi:hypothetical protein